MTLKTETDGTKKYERNETAVSKGSSTQAAGPGNAHGELSEEEVNCLSPARKKKIKSN